MEIDRDELDKEMLFDAEGRWYTARLNLAEVTRGTTTPPARVIINDETLREGEETPGVYVSVADKVKVARALEAAGVPEIVVGFTGTVQEHFDLVHILREEGITAHLTSRAFAFRSGRFVEARGRPGQGRAASIALPSAVSCRSAGSRRRRG